MRRRSAFTLIELLIVVAIIAILAAIAVPNFLEAQTRAKVSRTKADMASIATALESYRVDSNKYPDPTYIAGGSCYILPAALTTPIGYISSYPRDPFGEPDGRDLYLVYNISKDYYYATKNYFDKYSMPWKVYRIGSYNEASWDLLSKGPDKSYARSLANGGAGVDEVDMPYYYEYDPTNGTISIGNIIRTGP